MITTLAEWKKRLVVGAQMRQVWNLTEKETNHLITVTVVQTNRVYGTKGETERPAWIAFPKREQIEFTQKGWRRVDPPLPGNRGVRYASLLSMSG